MEQIAAARAQGLCSADSATTSPSIEYCATDLTFGKKNAAVNALVAESVLCVAVDNNEVAGEYFAAAPEEQMTVANAFLKNPKAYSFASSINFEASDALAVSTNAALKTAYSPGDAIRIFTTSASKPAIYAPVLTGFGAAIGSNECWELNVVHFEFAQEPAMCTRKAVQLESACTATTGFLSAALFVQNVLVAKWPNVTSSSTGSGSELLSIDVEVEEFNYATGTLTALQKPYPSYVSSPELVKNSSSMSVVCRGALLRLDYVVYHDNQGHLERIKAHVTIGNLTSTAATVKNNASLVVPVDVTQTFSVTFQSQTALSSDVVSLANGNLQTYQRSGNPGYLLHLPLRVGVLTTNSESTAATRGVQVVSEMTGGLQIPGLGDCLGGSSALIPQTIGFGEDSQTSCSLALSAAQFQALCTSSEALLPVLKVNFTHVAIFGNSDPFLSSSEWLALDYDLPVKSTARFSDATDPGTIELSCSDIITGVHFEFLVAGVGAARSPQHKIVAARASHSKEAWRFWKSGSASASEKQSFLLHTTVSFVFMKPTELEQLIPPAPPIWFSIPNDVFYPFILNDASSVATRPPWEILGLLWLVSVLYLV